MDLKQQAAVRALEYVHSGMTLGLGSGSTAACFVDLLGAKLQSGELHDLQCVATSEKTAMQARELGIPLTSLAGLPGLDLAVDGADEVDPSLNLIKGLGRALLREKVIEIHARQFVVIVDESKMVSRLGSTRPLPVELVQFEAQAHIRWLNTLGCRAELWLEDDGRPVVTDNGNFLALLNFPDGIEDPCALAKELAFRPGIVEHGLFLNMADTVIAAGARGVRLLERET